MNIVADNSGNSQMRLLVAIASFGEKNVGFLRQVIRKYQELPMEVDVIVFSNTPKDLARDVKVIVGLPSRNPFSLPFAHKAYFGQNVEQYDLFIYTEDDVELTEKNIRAFLRMTAQLAPDEIAGYLRYERDSAGAMSMPDVHGPFHWKVESVRRRGDYAVAEFSNEHAGIYVLTQAQLRRAIASGGFLLDPWEGRYGMLETAATDPYTSCGLRKVVCISNIDDFLLHHMSNRYVGQAVQTISAFKNQIETLMRIGNGEHPSKTLFAMGSKILHGRWHKSYYEKPSAEFLEMVPKVARNILSIGCGWGAMEKTLQKRGAEVTALPLDSVIGAVAVAQGIKVIYGTWEECLKSLDGRQFDCILMKDLLHLQADPEKLIGECLRLVKRDGALVLGGPNFNRIPWFLKRLLGAGEFRKLGNFDLSGITVCGPESLVGHIQSAGFRISRIQWLNHEIYRGPLHGRRISLGKLTARDWILQARRKS